MSTSHKGFSTGLRLIMYCNLIRNEATHIASWTLMGTGVLVLCIWLIVHLRTSQRSHNFLYVGEIAPGQERTAQALCEVALC